MIKKYSKKFNIQMYNKFKCPHLKLLEQLKRKEETLKIDIKYTNCYELY
jgi:phage FluMu protein Com